MVDKNDPAGVRYGQFIDLPRDTIALEPSQPLLRRALANRDYADADIIHLGTFIRNNPNPILVFSPTGEVIKTNPAAIRLLKHLQTEPLALLPAEHGQIVAACLEGQRQEYTIEVVVNNIYLALTYRSLPAFKLVYLYAIELTDYRQAEAELLQVASKTIDLAKRAVLQLQILRHTLPKPAVAGVAPEPEAVETEPEAVETEPEAVETEPKAVHTANLTEMFVSEMFVSMDGCVFASAIGGRE